MDEANPDKGGRPTKVSRELADRIAALILGGLPEEQAAEQAGIDKATFFNWMKWGKSRPEFSEFFQVIQSAKAKKTAKAAL